MKINCIFQVFTLLFFVFTASAQQSINYKAIINDDTGNPLANTAITVQFTILENGTINVYQEIQNPSTDANGIIIVNIGEGTPVGGDFITIDWGSNPHFLKTEIDDGDGLSDMGTTEFKSVPYSFHAKDAATKSYVDQLESRIVQLEDHVENFILYGDTDSDGYSVFDGDCNDMDPFTYPGAQEICEDGIDQDCDGEDLDCADVVTDYDGNVYSTVQIGNQIWMAENLRTTSYNDGTSLTFAPDNYSWDNCGGSGNCYCWYYNNETQFNIYGAIYKRYAVTNNICPVGWHVATNADWEALFLFLGGDLEAGGKMKITGTDHWISPNEGATNESGFSAYPAPGRYYNGEWFPNPGTFARWWSGDGDDNQLNWGFALNNDSEFIIRPTGPATWYGMSVRCVKD